MTTKQTCILTINGGSSSIKFALYEIGEPLAQVFFGEIENIGTKSAVLNYYNIAAKQNNSLSINSTDYDQASNFLIEWLQNRDSLGSVKAIGHRVVHGMQHTAPEKITAELLDELKKISAYDPEHLPAEIKLIELFGKRCPGVVQVACFDTAFHTTMPLIAKMLSIPRKYYDKGIRRYGFHGLSYAYLLEELKKLAGNETAQGKIILAHLGSGASLAAVKNGRSIDTTMGFTAAAGLPMGTRCGDLDPGVAWYLMEFEQLKPKGFNELVNHESGLLGISEISSDMRELMKVENSDSRAAEAIELFCYQIKKCIGAYAAALCGLETLVFSGGIGENSHEVRRRVCDCLEFLGIELDEMKNMNNEPVISTGESKVAVRIIKTNEGIMIARLVCNFLNQTIK